MTTGALGLEGMAGFAGEVLRPDDAGYDEHRRLFNAMHDRRPALIARATSTDDVVAAVRHATSAGLSLSIHGGGHGVAGHAACDRGIMLDLRPMKGVELRDGDLVRAQPGLTWGEFDAATQAHGLAVTGGRVSTTGVAGLTLGSGSGWTERKLGLTSDRLVGAEVVLASGEVVECSDEAHPELMWGLRGGGGNFGVVTRFDFHAAPLGPEVFAGMLLFRHERAVEIGSAWRELASRAPDELGGGIVFMGAPPLPTVPAEVHGRPVIGMIVTWAGDPREGEEAVRPLLELPDPLLAMAAPMPYVAVQQLIDPGNPPGMRQYWNGDFLTGLPDEAIAVLAEHTARVPSPASAIVVVPGGGAIARFPGERSALGDRDAPFSVHYLSQWPEACDDAANVGWTRELVAAMAPYRTGGAYVNFMAEEGAETLERAFGTERRARLVAVKDRYDPGNVFCHNQNIRPSRVS